MGGEVQLPEPSHSARVGLRWGRGCCSAHSWGCGLVSGGSFSLWALGSGCFRGEPWSGEVCASFFCAGTLRCFEAVGDAGLLAVSLTGAELLKAGFPGC